MSERATPYWAREIEDFVVAASLAFGCEPDDLKARTRKRPTIDARQAAAHAAATLTSCSYSMIGSVLRRDHSTVIHARKTVDNYLECDQAFRERYEVMLDLIGTVNTTSNR